MIVHTSLTWGELGLASSGRCLQLNFHSVGGQSFQVLLDTGSSDLVHQVFWLFLLRIDCHLLAVGCLIKLYGPGLCKGAEIRHE